MLSRAARLPEPAGSAISAAAGTLSRLRGKRIFHPDGVGFRGMLTPTNGGLGATALVSRSAVIVRLSRGLGLPERLPDFLGLAFRVPDAFGPGVHQDVLMASSASAAFGRYLLFPARGFLDRPYTTLFPYDLRGERIVLEAGAPGAERPGPGLSDLRRGRTPRLEYELSARTLAGPSRPVARLSLEARLDEAETERLDFDPTNTGGGLELAGVLNRLRGPAYRGSQVGRGLPKPAP